MAAHILVLSPDTLVAEVVADALDLEGYRVTSSVYHDGLPVEAREVGCDLLVFDYGGGTQPPGADLLPAVQDLMARTAVPVVIITTTPPALAAQAAWIEAEHIFLLPAPFPLDTLLAVVQTLLARSRDRLAESRDRLAESHARLERSQARIGETEGRLNRPSPPPCSPM